jgi:TrmH family RNA methyltransferase
MTDIKLKVYKKELDITYCLGVFSILELLNSDKLLYVDRIILAKNSCKNKGVDQICDICQRHHIEIVYDDFLIKKLSSKENTLAIAAIKKYKSQISQTKSHIVLVNPSNMGNLGGIIRTMLALGCKDLALITPCADIFDPKVIASSMGAFFHINFQHFNTLSEYKSYFDPNRKIFTFYLHDSIDLRIVDFHTNHLHADEVFHVQNSFVFGNESSGLSPYDANLGQKVKIPQFGVVDSFNLHVSVGIVLWEVLRRNSI